MSDLSNEITELSAYDTLMYYHDEKYREEIDKTHEKISLNFESREMSFDEFFYFRENLINVSPLKNVYKLELNECNNLKDVSSLKNVHELSLRYCDSLEYVKKLDNVHDLNLGYCDNLKDVSGIKETSILNLQGCKKIKDISMLTNVRTLKMYNF
jgi:hypothetical protein